MRAGSETQTEVSVPIHRGILAATAGHNCEEMADEREIGSEGKCSQRPDEETELSVEVGGDGHKVVEGRGVDPAAEEPGPGGEGGPDPPLPAGRLEGNVHCKQLDRKLNYYYVLKLFWMETCTLNYVYGTDYRVGLCLI